MTKQNPTPAEVQASLNATLGKFIDDQRTPDDRGKVLIKIGMYQADLRKYLPMIDAAGDDEFTDQVLGEWFNEGDAELKKMVLNCECGVEEVELAKAAPEDEGILALAKMVDDSEEGSKRIAMVQKVGHYTMELRKMLERIQEQPDDKQVEIVRAWILDGDGTHFELKKAVVSAEQEMRRRANDPVGEKEAVDQTPGNASTAATGELDGASGAKNAPDSGIRRTVPSRSSSPGGGASMDHDNQKTDGEQGDSENLDEDSGTDESNGAARTRPSSRIRRKGSTGGLGSVKGAEDPNAGGVDSASMNDPQARAAKSADDWGELGVDMLKIAPAQLIEAIDELNEDDQVVVVGELGQHAADLMAWSDYMGGGDQLQKRDLDASIAEWLNKDPETFQLKKWVAEALATAEEIPLELAVDIMAWTPPGAAKLNKQEIADGLQEKMEKINFGALAGAAGSAARAFGSRAAGAATRGLGRAVASAPGQAALRSVGRAARSRAGQATLSGLGAAGRYATKHPLRTAAAAGTAGYVAGRMRS